MAVIKQTAKGKTYYYSRHTVDGKRPQVRIPDVDPDTGRKIDTDTKREKYDGKIAQQYAKGDRSANDRRRFGELVDEWVKVVLPTIGKPGSQRAYARQVTAITGTYPQKDGTSLCLAEMRLKNISSQHVTLWLSSLGHYAWNTRSNTLQLCRRIFATGVEWGWMARNPAKASTVKLPRKGAALKRIKHLEIDQIKRLLDASKDDTEYRRHALFIGTGMRKSEKMVMRSSGFDAEARQYRICPSYGNYDQVVNTIQSPKTEASAQSVFLDDRLIQLLREQIRHVAQVALASSNWPTHLSLQITENNELQMMRFENDFIWPVEKRFNRHNLDEYREAGHIDTGTRWSKAFKQCCKRAGIGNHTLHDLRHTCASIMINNGENIKTVQRQMRHAKASETLDTYSHLWDEQGHEAIEAMSKAVGW